MTKAGDRDILTLPAPEESASGIAAALAAGGARRFPIDAAKVIGLREEVYDLRLTLPDGWTVELPPSVTAASHQGS